MSEQGKGLAVVCKWNEKQFGRDKDSSRNIDNHWFVLEVLEDEDDTPHDRLNFYAAHCDSHVSLDIVDYFCLPGHEMVAVLKTFWLKLIQRKWKKVYNERMKIKEARKSPLSIIHRERTGRWEKNLEHLPGLYGMMRQAKEIG